MTLTAVVGSVIVMMAVYAIQRIIADVSGMGE
jgi:hypothetical protein